LQTDAAGTTLNRIATMANPYCAGSRESATAVDAVRDRAFVLAFVLRALSLFAEIVERRRLIDRDSGNRGIPRGEKPVSRGFVPSLTSLSLSLAVSDTLPDIIRKKGRRWREDDDDDESLFINALGYNFLKRENNTQQ